jgi:hypothetical protein
MAGIAQRDPLATARVDRIIAFNCRIPPNKPWYTCVPLQPRTAENRGEPHEHKEKPAG